MTNLTVALRNFINALQKGKEKACVRVIPETWISSRTSIYSTAPGCYVSKLRTMQTQFRHSEADSANAQTRKKNTVLVFIKSEDDRPYS